MDIDILFTKEALTIFFGMLATLAAIVKISNWGTKKESRTPSHANKYSIESQATQEGKAQLDKIPDKPANHCVENPDEEHTQEHEDPGKTPPVHAESC